MRPERVGFLAFLVINRVWCLHSSLDIGMFLRCHFFNESSCCKPGEGGGEGSLIWAMYVCAMYVRPERVGFSAVLVINRVWCLHSSLELGMFFRRSYFFRS